MGRRSALETLTQRLVIKQDCQRISIVGLGGIGKTQVALEFAYNLKENWPDYSIFWVSVLSLGSFQQTYDDILKEFQTCQKLEEQDEAKELVKSYLSSKEAGKWLLILDNADDKELLYNDNTDHSQGIANYLPESEDGLILFTTRHQEIAVSLAGNDVIELKEMNHYETRQFFEKLLIQEDLYRNVAIVNELLDELNSLPLAITQAASYINTNKITLSQYLKLLRNTEQDFANLISREFRDNTRYAKSANAVARTWALSFEQIRKHDVAAANLFAYMSCLEPKAIPRSILPPLQPEERMVNAIGTLCAYSFIVARTDSDIYDMHSLVHSAKRIWVKKHNLTKRITAEVIDHLVNMFPRVDFTNQAQWRLYLPHTVRLCREARGQESEARILLCLQVGRCAYEDSRFNEAVGWMEEAYSSCLKKPLEEDHPIRLSAQHELAGVYEATGKGAQAIQLLEHVVVVEKRILPEHHPHRLASQHELARTYLANERVEEAVELLEHVVSVWRQAGDHPDQLISQHELARAYHTNAQTEEAIRLLEEVVAVRRTSLAKNHPTRMMSERMLEDFRADLADNIENSDTGT